jgi:hypothetical protein
MLKLILQQNQEEGQSGLHFYIHLVLQIDIFHHQFAFPEFGVPHNMDVFITQDIVHPFVFVNILIGHLETSTMGSWLDINLIE